jgi:hypothetical protein
VIHVATFAKDPVEVGEDSFAPKQLGGGGFTTEAALIHLNKRTRKRSMSHVSVIRPICE